MRLYKLTESDLSFVQSGMSDRRKTMFQKGLDMYDQFTEEGELSQTEFKSMKELLQYGIDEAMSDLVRKEFYHAGAYEDLPDDVQEVGYLNTGLHLTRSSLKKAKKFPDHEVTRLTVRFFEELVDLSDGIKELKGKIINRRQKKSDEKKKVEDAKQKVYLSSKDLNMVKDVLTRVTTDLKDELLVDNTEWLISIVDKWKKQYDPNNPKTSPREYYRNNSFNAMLVERSTERSDTHAYKLTPKYKDYLKKEAVKMTDDMIEFYVTKNQSKLAEIVTQKKGLKDVELLRTHAGRGRIEGTMKLTFDDSSSFIVDSNLVQSYSVHGKPFVRYPTTFHNVVMPDGSKMKGKASEARMKDEFVGVRNET